MRGFSNLVVTIVISMSLIHSAQCAQKGGFVALSSWGRSKIPNSGSAAINRERLISMEEAAGIAQSSQTEEHFVEWVHPDDLVQEQEDPLSRTRLKRDLCAGLTLCVIAGGIIYWLKEYGPW